MKMFLTAMTAVPALMVAAPAAAQYQRPYDNGNNQGYNQQGYNQGYNANGTAGMDDRLARIEARIDAGVQSGSIDRREAWRLRRQLSDIQRLDAQYSRNGYSATERADMQARLRAFRDDLRVADGGSSGYGNSGYGNSGYDNGRYTGQGGPYEEVNCDSRAGGGLGGLIDSIFGGGRDDCATGNWGVGARASSDWYAVPYQYRSQYRDNGSVYYRSDGRSIYGIDARTNTVVRVYPMNR
jgi:hypothetical protein